MRHKGMTDARRLADFAGRWSLSRHITPVAGPHAQVEGDAHWRAADGGLTYVEKGLMTLAGQTPLHAERRYFWAEDLSVHFDDGRFFHKVPKTGGVAHHWCDPDTYHVTYDFTDWPRFEVHWRVQGPRKDYRAVTHYSRL